MMNTRRWNELSETERETMMSMISGCIDARNGSAAKIGEECTIDFENGLSVSGFMTEDGPVVDDNAVIYNPTN